LLIPPGTTQYFDNTVVAGTFYDYKLSDDQGTTFSSVVSVVIQTCVPGTGSTQSTTGPGLPQFVDDASITAEALNQLSHQVEVSLSAALAPPGYCVICSSNGAVVLDCTTGCNNFWIVTTEDINSISSIGCAQDGDITFIVPANTTRNIRGWALGSSLGSMMAGTQGYTIVTGNKPQAVTAQHSCKCDSRIYGEAYIVYTAAGVPCVCDDRADGTSDVPSAGPISTASGSCTPNGGLTLAVFKANGTTPNPNNSMNCSTDKGLKIQACGGIPPYTWSFTGNINFVGSSTGAATVLAATNNGSGVSGVAYEIGGVNVDQTPISPDCSAPVGARTQCGSTAQCRQFNCNDQIVGTCFLSGDCPSFSLGGTSTPCTGGGGGAMAGSCNVVLSNCDGTHSTSGSGLQLLTSAFDKRSGTMISNGCAPCALTASGSTVTCRDSIGTQVTIVLTI
jgi:hypothetical protein